MSGIVFLFYWLFGLRLPALEFVGYWVELGLGAEMRNSVGPHSDEYSLGSEVLCLSSGSDLELRLQELLPNPGFANQDPTSCKGQQKKKKRENNNKVKNKIILGN